MQVILVDGMHTLNALLLGDLSYPDLNSIFSRSKADDLLWTRGVTPSLASGT